MTKVVDEPREVKGVIVPFYRYHCGSCGHEFKALHPWGNDAAVRCPTCGSVTLERLLPRIGVIYKGNGYYATDYASKRKTSQATTSAKAGE